MVQKVVTGVADAGFAYASDVVAQKGKVNVVNIPSDLNAKAEYGIALMKESQNLELAQEYVNFLFSKRGIEFLKKWGFTPAS